MKTSIFLPLAALARQIAADDTPNLQWDPETAKDCIEWVDGYTGSCEHIRDLFNISPEQFHQWNPSVGLDCKPWSETQSYCILTLEKFINTPPPTLTTGIPGSVPGLAPSPTAWADRGCYVQNTATPVIEAYLSMPGGDAALTVAKCKDRCYRAQYKFAGVQEGNQCWCGRNVTGEWTSNQADCNTPCSGDSTTSCGGKGLVHVFQAEANQFPATSTGSGTRTSTGTSTGTGTRTSTGTVTQASTASETRSSSGAVRNVAFNLW